MSDDAPDTPAGTDDRTDDATEGRFFLLTGPGRDEVARALAARLPRAASVDGPVVGAMFTAQNADTRTDLEQTFLRYTAGIALADSFRLAGYDAVVADHVPPDHLEDYLDFAAPASVLLVRLGEDDEPGLPGLALAAASPETLVDQILNRVDEARVDTVEGGQS